MMRIWMIAPLGIALLSTACGQSQLQRAGTGAAGGALAGGLIAGPFGALAGAGIGAAGGAYRETVDETVDEQTENLAEAVLTDDRDRSAAASRRDMSAAAPADRTSRERAAVEDGLTNREVREAQTTLRDLGLYEGAVDGIYGPRTISAVGDFQAQQNLPRTGALTDRTKRQLRARSAAANGNEPRSEPGQNRQPTARTPANEGAMPSDSPE